MPSATSDCGVPTGAIVSSRRPRPCARARPLWSVLGVVPRIELVGEQVRQRVGAHRDVGVDRHAAPQTAEVVVEAGPGLARDQLELAVFAVRQTEELRGPAIQLVVDGAGSPEDHIGRQLSLAPPGAKPLAQVTRARDELVEAPVRLLELALGRRDELHAETAPHLVGEGHLDAGEALGDGREALDLRRQPALAPLVAERTGERAAQIPRFVGERRGRGRLLAAHPLGQLRRPVGIDEAVDVPPDTQRQQDVALDDVHHPVTSLSPEPRGPAHRRPAASRTSPTPSGCRRRCASRRR